MFKGKYSWIAEAFGGALLFLLPLKFGTLVSVPAITMIYWNDPVSLLIASWPFPVFPLFAAVFLFSSLFLVPAEEKPGKGWFYALLWGLLALSAIPGIAAAGNPPDAALYFLDHAFSIGAFLIGFQRILQHNRKLLSVFHGVFTAAFVMSLLIGLNQYFSGYQETIDQLQRTNMDKINGKLIYRLEQMRVSGGFSACNAFAGYLVLGLPIALAGLWKAGNRVSPPAVSRLLFTIPVLCAGLFLLMKTGSRGGLLSLFAGTFFMLFASKMKLKHRLALSSLIPLGIAGITALIMLGRGGKSILFRLDYLQGAFRMMLDSPLTGTGWGGFQRQFMKMKWILDPEAPASPHNFPLTFGSQAGAAGFLLSLLILSGSVWFLFRMLLRTTFREKLREEWMVPAAFFCGITGWAIHSLQEILYETPGTVVLFGSMVLLSFAMIEPEVQEEPSAGSEKKHLLRRWSWNSAVFLYGIAAIVLAWNTLSFDKTLSVLNDMTDYRMLPPEQMALIKHSDVQNAFEAARKKNPDSPYPYLSFSDFLAARGETETALQLTRKAVELDPENSGFRVRLYRMLKLYGYQEEALQHLRRAADLFPMNPDYREMLKQETL